MTKLNQVEINKLSKSEITIKQFQVKKYPSPNGFIVEFCHNIAEEFMLLLF